MGGLLSCFLHPQAAILYLGIALERSAAPVCSVESKNASSFTIPWQQYKQTIDRFSRSFQLYPGLTAFNQRSAPYSHI